MGRNLVKLAGIALVMAMAVGGVQAATTSSVPLPVTHKAPAPLLAAGFPAFAALGGAAFIRRIVRRRTSAGSSNGASS